MPELAMSELLDAGCHFGHQTKRWNPKMKPYIYGARNDVYIINLEQTLSKCREAMEFVRDTVARGGDVLFVGTKKQAAPIIEDEALRVESPFVTNRWLGGMLTNYQTIQASIQKLADLERMKEDGTYEKLAKKEVLKKEKLREKLNKYLRGIRTISGRLPAAIFVVDTNKERIAVLEARKLDVPVIAIVDTNCDPDLVDFVIPGNDDALRAIRLITSKIADAVAEGKALRETYAREGKAVKQKAAVGGAAVEGARVPVGPGPAVEIGVGRLEEEAEAEAAAAQPEAAPADKEGAAEEPGA